MSNDTTSAAKLAIAVATDSDIYHPTFRGGDWLVPAVETRDTLADFEAAIPGYRMATKIRRGTIAGLPYIACDEVQVAKGDTRRSLTVIDLGDVRVALDADICQWAD